MVELPHYNIYMVYKLSNNMGIDDMIFGTV